MLEYAAKYKESLLLNRYRAGRAQIARGLSTAPYAYVIPQDQRDVVAAVEAGQRMDLRRLHWTARRRLLRWGLELRRGASTGRSPARVARLRGRPPSPGADLEARRPRLAHAPLTKRADAIGSEIPQPLCDRACARCEHLSRRGERGKKPRE